MTTLKAPPHVPPPRWKAIYDQLYMELSRYEYGSSFYSISAICKKFDVSSITAIRALNELASRDLIEKIPGKGNVVRQSKQKLMVRLVLLSENPQSYLTLWPVAQRLINGVKDAASRLSVDFDCITGSHLQLLFSQPRPSTGFLFFGNSSDPAVRQYLKDNHYPYLLIDPFSHFNEEPHVRIDRVASGYMAASHLLSLGHRRIGIITGSLARPNFRDRIRGARRAMKQAGVPFDKSLIRQTAIGIATSLPEDEAAILSLMQEKNPPTAIILGDDTRGVHVLEACRRNGIRVPEDLSLISYPNHAEASLTTPGLTAVDACFEQVGATALEQLIHTLEDPSAKRPWATLIAPRLVERQSCSTHQP